MSHVTVGRTACSRPQWANADVRRNLNGDQLPAMLARPR
jgi:hypothetical protein